MSEKTRAELKEQIKIMNHNYQVIREMHEKGYQYSVGEIKRLQDELDCTRKALAVAVDALKSAKTRLELINNSKFANLNNVLQIQSQCEVLKINEVLEKITALEQKE